MFTADYHTHSLHSPDGSEPLARLADAALAAGLNELAVTDHCDVGPHAFHRPDARAYREELLGARSAYAGRLKILQAVELGEASHNAEMAAAVLSENDFDFVIGSYHILKDGTDFWATPWRDAEIARERIPRYLDECMELVASVSFDVLGHLTYPLRYMNGRYMLDLSFDSETDRLRELFGMLVHSGRGIELNVSGLLTAWGRPMPELSLLRLYRSCGGEIITVGTDAHTAPEVGAGIRDGYELLRQAGFRYVTAFSERKPRYEKIV